MSFPYLIALTNEQMAAIWKAATEKKASLILTIPYDKLVTSGGKYSVDLTPYQAKTLKNAVNSPDKKPWRIMLKREQINALADPIAQDNDLKRPKGGFVTALLTTLAAPLISGVVDRIQNGPQAISEEETDPALRRLKFLRGRGAELQNDMAFLKGVKKASDLIDNPEVKALVLSGETPTKKEFEEVVGSGIYNGSGSGWNSFWSGFKLMFTDPISGFELLGREIKRAVTGKGEMSAQTGSCPLCAKKKLVKGSGVAVHEIEKESKE